MAIKQARGDMIEAIFLLRAFRATLAAFRRRPSRSRPARWRFAAASPRRSRIFPAARFWARPSTTRIACSIRSLDQRERSARACSAATVRRPRAMPRVTDILGQRRSDRSRRRPIDPDAELGDLTREPLSFPADRDLRLQNLARGDEGFLLALGYSTQRGYGRNPSVCRRNPRSARSRWSSSPKRSASPCPLGVITVTECQMVNQFKGSATEAPCFTRGYGLAFGQCERKAMSMALVDRALRARELGEETSRRRRRTRNSCCRIPTMCRRPASSSI